MSNVVNLRSRQSGRDRLLNIATGATVSNNRVKNERLTWAQMIERFHSPTITKETIAEYLKMPRETQDRIKDTGYFVPAHYQGNVRRKENLGLKDLGTLDFDHAGPEFLAEMADTYDGYEFVLYTTHKHTAEKPRFRLVFIFSRAVNDEEYPAIMRRIAAIGNIDDTDDTTFQPSRVMHFPSHSRDGVFISKHFPGAAIDVDRILAGYNDWHDVSQWPVSSRVSEPLRLSGRKAQDPREKTGVIGAFCRTYDILEAIEKFIPDSYVPGASANRLTYRHSTASNGAILYDDNQFLFSNHESDPCSGKNVNSFDLVRLHMFGELDAKQPEDTTPSNLKSYKAMVLLAKDDPDVKMALLEERMEIADEFTDFDTPAESDTMPAGPAPPVAGPGAATVPSGEGSPPAAAAPAPPKLSALEAIKAWKLKVDDYGIDNTSIRNLEKILENDSLLQGCVRYNAFICDLLQLRKIPGTDERVPAGGLPWSDTTEVSLKSYIERRYGIVFNTKLLAEACGLVGKRYSFDPVREWMDTLEWDGVPRLSTFLHEVLGAEDNDYHAAVFTKWLCGGVARTYHPGHKFDNMLVLEDDEGKGKSRLIRAIANGWFTDDFSFGLSSKEVVEQAKGALIIEVQEMTTRSSADVEHIKAFLSRSEERVRMAYARNTGYFPRRWIAAGTTNETTYLRSETGNRRFWCVRGDGRLIDVDAVKEVVPQLWAEAKDRYLVWAEPLYIENKEVLAYAMEQQAARVEIDEWAMSIAAWLNKPVAKNYWEMRPGTKGDFDEASDLIDRDRVNATEIWIECLSGQLDRLDQRTARRISSIMKRIGGWAPQTGIRFGTRYEKGRGFIRK